MCPRCSPPPGPWSAGAEDRAWGLCPKPCPRYRALTLPAPRASGLQRVGAQAQVLVHRCTQALTHWEIHWAALERTKEWRTPVYLCAVITSKMLSLSQVSPAYTQLPCFLTSHRWCDRKAQHHPRLIPDPRPRASNAGLRAPLTQPYKQAHGYQYGRVTQKPFENLGLAGSG